MSLFVGIAFSCILLSLALALFFMLRRGESSAGDPKQMAKALTYRIGISVLLFLCIVVAWRLGWIQPTGIPLRVK